MPNETKWDFGDAKSIEAKHGNGRRRLGRGERPAHWRIRK